MLPQQFEEAGNSRGAAGNNDIERLWQVTRF
jgi:hypothetical protein